MDVETLRVILMLQREYFERWQSWPTATQILAQLHLDVPESDAGSEAY